MTQTVPDLSTDGIERITAALAAAGVEVHYTETDGDHHVDLHLRPIDNVADGTLVAGWYDDQQGWRVIESDADGTEQHRWPIGDVALDVMVAEVASILGEGPDEATPTEHPHAGLIAGLTELADWYRAHPEVPAPRFPGWRHCVGGLSMSDEDQHAEVRAVADALGVPATGDLRRSGAQRQFGPVTFEVFHVGSEPMRRHNAEVAYIETLTDEQLGLTPAPESETESDR